MTDNAFTPAQGIPSNLVAGDLWTWRLDEFAALYPSAVYSLAYSIAPKSGGAPTSAPAVADADGWVVSILPAVTTALAPTAYAWTLIATRTSDGARVSIRCGDFTVSPDPSQSNDTRSQAQRLLDAVNAVLEGRATKDVEAYSIEGRSLTRTPFEILRNTRVRLMREVQAEQAAAKGKGTGPRYRKVRF